MTGEFSRRSFLKYTALTAVAVAGSSLLSGCEYGYNPVQHAPGTSNTVLKVVSTLDWVECDSHVLYIFPPRIPEVFGSHRSGCGRCQSAGRL